MADDLTTVFLPLIDEARMAQYAAADFQIAAHPNDPGVDVVFSPKAAEDRSIFMIAPGEVFFVPAGATITFTDGPEVTAPNAKSVAVVHVVSTYDWAPILATTGQPVAEWWAFEGLNAASFEQFIDTHDLEALASPRGFASGAELRVAILSGAASLNVLLLDAQPVSLGTLGDPAEDPLTLGVRAWASYDTGLVEQSALSALATIRSLAPVLAAHPLLAQVLTGVSASDVTIHVRFVFWQPNAANAASETDKGQFVPVLNGSKISLVKRSPGPAYATIVEAVVAANGQVALTVPRAELNALNLAGGESLVFRVDVPANTRFTPQYQHGGSPRSNPQPLVWGIFNHAWLTEGRSTRDETVDSLDFLVNYANSVVGSSVQPIEYCTGIPIFLQIQYPVVFVSGAGAAAKFNEQIRKAPKGIQVDVFDATHALLGAFRTDEHGQIWGMLASGYDTLQLPFEVVVTYHMQDRNIGLLPIEGEVVQGGNPAVTTYSSNASPLNSIAFSASPKSCLGKPDGAGTATALATLQVGFVNIAGAAVSEFTSTDGRHAGLMHALQQVRYVHQWFHHLTQGYTAGGRNESWDKILDNHNRKRKGTANGGAIQYDVLLPKIRVSDPKTVDPETGNPNLNETISGEVTYDQNDLPNLRWWLILYGYDAFKMNQRVRFQDAAGVIHMVNIPQLENKAQFWRVHTIWHEFTHAVVNMAWDRLFNLDNHSAMVTAKDGSTSGRVHQVIVNSIDVLGNALSGGWSTLEEALAAVPEVALMERASGEQPLFDPPAPAAPRFMVVDIDAAGLADGVLTPATDLMLSQGMSVDLNRLTGPPVFNDQRLGLRVPIALTWGLWNALKNPGGFNETLERHVTSDQALNDLKDAVSYLSAANIAKAKRIFKTMFWGPLIALRTPNIPGAPPQWNDLTGPVNGPTTFSFMQAIQTGFWNALSAADKTKIRELVEDADNPESFYLWFSFP